MSASSERHGAEQDRREVVFAVVGVVVVVVWCAAVASGLGRALLGASAARLEGFLLYLPGVVAGSALIAYAAWCRLRAHAPRWVPREPVAVAEAPVAEEMADEPGDVGLEPLEAPILRTRMTAEPALAIVHLGPGVDPAWAPWGLRWEAPGHGSGLTPLPVGAPVVLGRDPAAEIVARLDQVSWHHLELDVQEGRVIAFELGSKNGTRTDPDGEPLPERTPIPWAPGEALHLASPVALTLVLEPLR
jgi:hypothetical protein